MMKYTIRKALCLILSILLILPTAFSAFAQGTEPLALSEDGGIGVLEVKTPGVPDGVISGAEYGSADPTLHLTAENGFWAEDLEGNELTENLPNYVDLYLARDAGALYAAIKVNQDNAHSGKEYFLTTFLGLDKDAEKGAITEFKLYEKAYTNRSELGTKYYFETIVTKLEANGGDRLYSINPAYEFPLPNWGSVKTEEDGTTTYLFEIELNFADSALAGGTTFDGTLENAHFSFDLALFTGDEQTGVLHFNKAKTEDETLPELSLTGGNADLAELSASGAVSFAPLFDSEIYEYEIVVPFGTLPGITVKTADENARVEIRGESELGTTGEGTIEIIVHPANGAKPKQYNVTLTRQKVTTNYETSADNLDALLKEIAETKWTISDAVSIKLDGTYQNQTELLFNQPTIFTTSGTKLPITITGTSTAKIEILTDKVVSANDFTFEKVSMPIGMTEKEFYAGSGNVTFTQVDLGIEKGQTPKSKFFGDNYTMLAYTGWTTKNVTVNQNSEKLLPSSITFGKGMEYLSSESKAALLGAVGFEGAAFEKADGVTLDLAPEKLAASFIVDGATVSVVGARVSTSPVKSATVSVKSGNVSKLLGDDGVGNAGNAAFLEGDINITVSGGTVSTIRPLYASVLNGNSTVEISQIDAKKNPTVIGTILPSTSSEVKKNSTMNIFGGTFTGEVSGSCANLSTINNISGGTFKSFFFGLGGSGSRKVYNNITDGTFEATFYGGHSSSGYIRGVVNNISGGTFKDSFFGGNRSGTLYGNVENNLVGGNFKSTIYGGSEGGSITGTIKNKLTEISTGQSFYGGSYSASVKKITSTVTDSSLSKFMGGNYNGGTVTGDISTKVQDSTITNYLGGGIICTVNGNVTNEIIGASTISGFLGGTKGYIDVDEEKNPIYVSSNVKGTIFNTVSADENGNAPVFNKDSVAGSGLAYVGGSRGCDVKTVINVINAGTFNSRYHGGSQAGTMGADENGISVQNVINGGTFKDHGSGRDMIFTAGTLSATMAGDTYTVINDGTFEEGVGFGTRAMPHDGYTGTYRSVINGGTFKYFVFGGNMGFASSHEKDCHTVNVDMTINGGTFERTVFAGGWGANPIDGKATVTITGGTFLDNVRASSNASSPQGIAEVIIKQAPDSVLYFNGELEPKTTSQTVKLVTKHDKSNIQLGASASLTFNAIEKADAFQGFIAAETLTKDQVYVTLNVADTETEKYSDLIRFYGEDTDANAEFASVIKTVGSTGTTWTATGNNVAVISLDQLNGSPSPDFSEFQATETRLTQAKLDALPMLNASTASTMTAQERRQLAVDYFTLQCSFTWTPDTDVTPYHSILYHSYIYYTAKPEGTYNVAYGSYPARVVAPDGKIYCQVDCNDDGELEWVYDATGNKKITSADKVTVEKYINEGEYYGGIPYQVGGSGNLYRWLEYYDQNTGVVDMTRAIEENGGFTSYDSSLDSYPGQRTTYGKAMYNQCSYGAAWGWQRVINSVRSQSTSYMNVYNGYIPVGGYTYGYTDYTGKWNDMTTIALFGELNTMENDEVVSDRGNPGFYEGGELVGYDTRHVIADYNKTNGENAFQELYAKMQPGDCLVSGGHCLMVHSVDVQKREVRVIEQIEGWALDYDNRDVLLETYATTSGQPYAVPGDYTTMKGLPYTRQGRIGTDKAYTFEYLQKEEYIPFTFVEFHYDVDTDESRAYVQFYNEKILHLGTEEERHPKKAAVSRMVKRSDIDYAAAYEALSAEKKALYNDDLFISVEDMIKMCSPELDTPIIEVSQTLSYKDIDSTRYPTALGDLDLTKGYLTYQEYKFLNIVSNYALSDVHVTFTKDGEVAKEMVYRVSNPNYHYAMFCTATVKTPTGTRLYEGGTSALENQGYNISIKVQLSTGENVEIFNGYFGTK